VAQSVTDLGIRGDGLGARGPLHGAVDEGEPVVDVDGDDEDEGDGFAGGRDLPRLVREGDQHVQQVRVRLHVLEPVQIAAEGGSANSGDAAKSRRK
jgi:hypothetical protein